MLHLEKKMDFAGVPSGLEALMQAYGLMGFGSV
jgi:hypothetical protein